MAFSFALSIGIRCVVLFTLNYYYLTDISKLKLFHTQSNAISDTGEMNIVSFSVSNIANLELFYRCHCNIRENGHFLARNGHIEARKCFDLEYGNCSAEPSIVE